MSHQNETRLNTSFLAKVLDNASAGITVINREGIMLYYNAYAARFVDRKPEYIGKDIRSCHQHANSIEKIDAMLSKLTEGKSKELYYETERGGYKLGVTVSPLNIDGEQIGFIQCFSILH